MAPVTQISLKINGEIQRLEVTEDQSLLRVLRDAGYFGVKYGCGSGECGMCTVLIDGKATKSCIVKAISAEGKKITTIEGLSKNGKLDPVQEAFIETGAMQCGFCSPALILSAKALLDKNPSPTEVEIRRALNPVLCRCTGYVRAVNAIQRAAARIRGERLDPYIHLERELPELESEIPLPEEYLRLDGNRDPLPPLVYSPHSMAKTKVVGKSLSKKDANKLAQGKPVYADDFRLPGMLYGELLTSPHAHARIRRIDASKARQLGGVRAVLTCQDIPRVKYASGGQSYPQPLPYDQVCLDNKVRHVGDRVAIVAADTAEIARQALDLIEVDYEVLPAVVDPEIAMRDGSPVIHDEPDTEGIYDSRRNTVYHIDIDQGDVERGFTEADFVLEGEYRTSKQQQVHMEPHACITWIDDDDRLVIRSSTQVPYHIRRMISPVIGMPVSKIRVIKPRIGGGFGNKQEMILEDLCAHLTLATRRPVRMEYTRKQEFTSSRSRHPFIMRYKVGVKGDQVTTTSLYLIGNTGAYGTHGLTVNMVGGFKGLTQYNPPNARFVCDVVYTNTPPAGAFRGYGTMQCLYGIEVLMEEVAEKIGVDVVEFKRKNWIEVGETMHLSEKLGEGRAGVRQSLTSSGLSQCVDIGLKATDFYRKREFFKKQSGTIRQGIGMAVVMHGSGVANVDMASAIIKMNDDGSFNLLTGASDLGTGADTILSQIAAETLDVSLDDIIVHSGDTDFTPFDKGAYASSTTYISGQAVRKAALDVRSQILEHAAFMLGEGDPSTLECSGKQVVAGNGRKLTFEQIALNCLHQENQHQIMAAASHTSPLSPPPTAAQFAEIHLNMETGAITVDRLLMVVDCGRVINPITAAGQVEGGMAQGLGFALSEEMLFSPEGQPLNPGLAKYRIPRASEMPVMDVIFVQTDESSGPFGAKSVAEISIDGVAPAMASAIHNATGVWMREVPYTKERVVTALNRS